MTTTKEADRTLAIVKGYVDQSEITYESHKRGKNWTATVVFDPGAPGELDRDFWTSNGKNVEVPDNLRPGHIVEFAGDYYTTGGNKRPSREYFRVLDVTDSELVLEETSKPTKTTPPPDMWREERGYSNGDTSPYRFEILSEDHEDAPETITAENLDDGFPGIREALDSGLGPIIVNEGADGIEHVRFWTEE